MEYLITFLEGVISFISPCMLPLLLLLLSYSLGMGIPFLASAVLIDKLTSVINSIKKHYKIINTLCGLFLIMVGFAMVFGVMNELLAGLQYIRHKHLGERDTKNILTCDRIFCFGRAEWFRCWYMKLNFAHSCKVKLLLRNS